VFTVSISLLRKILKMHAKIKYTELSLILSLTYVKKFTRFCQVIKKCTQKKTGSFFLLHSVHTDLYWVIADVGEHWRLFVNFMYKKTTDIGQYLLQLLAARQCTAHRETCVGSQ